MNVEPCKFLGGGLLARGEVFSGFSEENVHFEAARTELGPPDEYRPRIEDGRFRNLRMEHCALEGALVKNVVVDGLVGVKAPVICFANEFQRVILKGHIRSIILNMHYPSSIFEQQYQEVLGESDQSDSISLDISDAVGEITIRGYSARRIVRNKTLHAVVRWENAFDLRWQLVDLAGTAFYILIDSMLRLGWPDVILVANPHGRDFDQELRAIQRLRDAGIAEED